jgi:cell division protein FtsL
MTRLNLVLLAALLGSAMLLVRTQYESRRLFVEVEKAQSLSKRLDTERERLEVDKRAQATPLRVEKIAKEQLKMRAATPAVTQYVKLPDAMAGTASSAAANTAARASTTGVTP